jgi:outer membrane protein OmpA-like peptidoglycan-associated protein
MKLKFAAVSLVALTLFAGVSAAQENTETPPPEQPAAEGVAVQLPEEIMALINDRRAAQELSDDELKARAKSARRAAKIKDVPDDVRSQLQALVDADRAELESRQAAQKPAEEKPAEQPVQEAAPKAEPQPEAQPEAQPETKAEQPPPPAEIPAEVSDLLNDARSLDELDAGQLAARAKFARQQSKNEALPEDVRGKLADIGKAARVALVERQKAEEAKKVEEAAPAPQPEAQPVQEAAPTPQPEAQPVQEAAPQPEVAPVVEQPAEAKAAEPVAPAAPVVVDKVEVKELDGNAGDPEAEKRARAFLDDATPAASLNDEALRTRLDGMRDLMAENELSVKTERALRDKLRSERLILRERVAKVKAEEEAKIAAAQAADAMKKAETQAAANPDQPAPRIKNRPNINIIITAETPVREVLLDRRDAEDIDESELRYRIRARRDFEASTQFRNFDEDQRNEWRDQTRTERRIMRQRLEQERNIRRVELEKPSNIRRIVIEDNDARIDDDIPEDIFAAEVEDSDIERALLAAPRKKIIRKVRAEDIASNPEARKAMTRIEIDTIRFGFNEAFVREEEVDNLDQIAAVIERIIVKYPREVFLIEGHTDAVGSDAYNAKLSKARAEAVKKALTTFYVIPAKNLQTVGLGERYLKIPTAEAEQENRRVSLSRATAVIGQLDE